MEMNVIPGAKPLSEPEPLYLGKEAKERLYRLGVKSLAVIMFDEQLGPVFQFYYFKRSRFIMKLLKNRALSVELSIMGKHVKELVLRDGTRIVVVPFMTDGMFGKKMNYLMAELREHVKSKKRIIETLEKMATELEGAKRIDEKIMSEVIRRHLLRRNSAK